MGCFLGGGTRHVQTRECSYKNASNHLGVCFEGSVPCQVGLRENNIVNPAIVWSAVGTYSHCRGTFKIHCEDAGCSGIEIIALAESESGLMS